MFAFLVTLNSFHLLASILLTVNLTPEWSGRSMFHRLSHIYAKTPFCCIETIANNALNHQHIVVFDWLWANMTPTLNAVFSLTNIHAKWWIHYLLISHASSIYSRPKCVCGVFWDNSWIWATWVFTIICLCTTTFKVSIPPLFPTKQSPNNTHQAIILLEQYFFPIRK